MVVMHKMTIHRWEPASVFQFFLLYIQHSRPSAINLFISIAAGSISLPWTMVTFTILAGGFSSFIVTYIFNSDAATLTSTKNIRKTAIAF